MSIIIVLCKVAFVDEKFSTLYILDVSIFNFRRRG